MSKLADFAPAALALAAWALFATSGATALQAATPEPEPNPEIAAQTRAVDNLRNVGTAMFAWLIDQPGYSEPPGEGDTAPCDCDEEGELLSYDMRDVPEISWEALRALLVPKYLRELPKNDPWGNPYEYRVERDKLLNRTVLSIRSAGSDGRFDAERYTVGGFPPAETAEDLAWANLKFLRWPETPKPEKGPVQK